MSTRLYYEKRIRETFPEIRWLRVFSPGGYHVYIYACDEMLELSEGLKARLEQFFAQEGMVSTRYFVKHYFDIRKDNVPTADDPPQIVKDLALKQNVTESGVRASIKIAFPFIDPESLEVERDLVKLKTRPGNPLTEAQRSIISLYLLEILPLGASVELGQG